MPRGIATVTLIMMAVVAMTGNVPPPVVAGSTGGNTPLSQAVAISPAPSRSPVQAPSGAQDRKVVAASPQGDDRPSEAGATPAASSPAPAHNCGIEPLSLRPTANGYLLDFRFRVLDPEKASALFDHKTKPYLEDRKTGAKFIVPEPPKVGGLRTSRKPKEGTTCFMLFANPGRYLGPGRDVTIVAGDSRINLMVNE